MDKIAHFLDDTAFFVKVGAFRFGTTVRAIEISWNNVNQFPERRARVELGALASRLNAFAEFVGGLVAEGGQIDATAELETFARRHLDLTHTFWARESRCASWFVVGPANFPVRRNQKRQQSADKAMAEIPAHEQAARKAVKRRAFPYGAPGEPIRGNNPDAPELIQENIDELRIKHAMRKLVNETIRKAGKKATEDQIIEAVMAVTGWSRGATVPVIRPNYMGKRGFEAWQLSNTLAEIKRLEGRLADIEAKRSRQPSEPVVHETTAGDVEVIENADADRIQLVFTGKPAETVRDTLKANGFRWSPREGAWQRHLNAAGRSAAERVLKTIARQEAAA